MMSSSIKTIAGLVVLLGTVLTAHAFVPQAPFVSAQNPMTAAPQTGPVPAAPAPGRGGRGNAIAILFTERCAGCHGAGVEGGRAPSLFDETWTRATDDEGVSKIIHDGIQGTEMMSFAASLTDQQIWQLVAYIRTQAATLKGKPTVVADPDGQVIKSE
ncbi:MAG: c-type cytochrome, partial [Acidobacteriota bacterium]|nr:c-type cytochrome [Acidobacteriota bacterium]